MRRQMQSAPDDADLLSDNDLLNMAGEIHADGEDDSDDVPLVDGTDNGRIIPIISFLAICC